MRMVEATGRLLQEQGYFATGVKQILEESGAPRGSFYFHFPGGKEELACAALEASGAAWREHIEQVVAEAPTAAVALARVCELLAERLEASAFRAGCPLATVALEAAASVDAVHEVCRDHFQRWQENIAARLVDEGMPEAGAVPLATLLLSSIEGAMMLCRAERTAEPLRQVAAALTAILASALRA